MMKIHAVIAAAVLVLWGCGSQAQEQSYQEKSAAKQPAPPKPISKDAETPTGERSVDSKDKDKRGNTPPGSTRAGDPPISGAISDPAGVTQK